MAGVEIDFDLVAWSCPFCGSDDTEEQQPGPTDDTGDSDRAPLMWCYKCGQPFWKGENIDTSEADVTQ